MTTRTILPVVCVFFTACASATEPAPSTFSVGRYAYTSSLGTGTLTLTYATADSIAGRWDVTSPVAKLVGPFILGRWNVDAFPVFADAEVTVGTLTLRPTYNHRISPTRCEFKIVPSSDPMTPCTLRYLGP